MGVLRDHVNEIIDSLLEDAEDRDMILQMLRDSIAGATKTSEYVVVVEIGDGFLVNTVEGACALVDEAFQKFADSREHYEEPMDVLKVRPLSELYAC